MRNLEPETSVVGTINQQEKRIKELEADNERLRAVLTRIQDLTCDGPSDQAMSIYQIAIGALHNEMR